MNDICQDKGGRLVQHMSQEQLDDMGRSFSSYGWVGVYDGKWTSDESLVPEDLWEEGYRSGASRRCGLTTLDYSSYSSSYNSSDSFKLSHIDCSRKRRGYCQFQMP
ncbi:uncharacterized protein [Palaemon carinicauda]|uniref:uncharacterized protein n=1 Tax=Palaemon carinicauda TaxID=392227 RepID=UPI0035B6760F